MARRYPSLNAIRVFEAAARHVSFSRAADELNVTQSAVSRQVQRLEEEIGQALFARAGPRLSLTACGREYYVVVQEGLGTIRRGTDRLFRASPRPVLTLTTLPSVVAKWLVPRLHEFEQLHPEISLHLSASYETVDFSVATDIDVAIRFGEGQWSGVAAELLVDDVIFPVCHPDLARRLVKPADLLRQRLLGESPGWDLWSDWFAAAGIAQAPPPPDRLSDDFNVQLDAAIFGHGVALARGLLVAEDLRAGRLVCPFRISPRPRLQYYFACPPGRLKERAIIALRDWLAGAARSTVEGLGRYTGSAVG